MVATLPDPAPAPPTPVPGSGRASVRRLQRPVVLVTTVGVLSLLVTAPMVMLAYGSLRDDSPGMPSSFTLANYELLTTAYFWNLVRTSVVIGLGATVVAMVIGGTLAAIIVRTDVPWPKLWDGMVMVPAYVTPFIGAVAWILLSSPRIGYLNTMLENIGLPTFDIYSTGGIIWVLGLYFAPFAYLFLRPTLARLDRSFEESSRVNGGSGLQTLRRIVVPLCTPAVLAATLVIFVNAIGNFGVPGVLGRQQNIEVLPVVLVRLTTQHPTNPNGAAVFGLALAALTVAGLWISNRIIRRRDFTTVTTQGSAEPIRLRLGAFRPVAVAICAGYVVIAVVLPVGAMVIASFQPYLTTDLGAAGFTLDNYRFVFSYPSVVRAITNSVLLGLGAAVGGSLLALLIAYIVVRTGWRGRSYVDYAGTATIAIPHTVFGLALVWMWISIPLGVYATPWILLLAYLALFLPYAVRSAVAGLRQVDDSFEEASRVLGGAWLLTLRKVTAPMLAPAVLSGAIMILYQSVRELPASMMLHSVGSEVMSVVMWEMISEGMFVRMFALAVVNLAIVVPLVAIASRLSRDTVT